MRIQHYVIYSLSTGSVLGIGAKQEKPVPSNIDEGILLRDSPLEHPEDYTVSPVGVLQERTIPHKFLNDVIPVLFDQEALNETIAGIIQSRDPVQVARWKTEKYSFMREHSYPPLKDFADAQVKSSSTDPEVVAIGELELAQYTQTCLEVKGRFPKPTS